MPETLHPTRPMLNEQEAAVLLGIEPQTLSNWRCTGRWDLPYCRIGRAIRYRLSDLNAWLEKRTVRPAPVEA